MASIAAPPSGNAGKGNGLIDPLELPVSQHFNGGGGMSCGNSVQIRPREASSVGRHGSRAGSLSRQRRRMACAQGGPENSANHQLALAGDSSMKRNVLVSVILFNGSLDASFAVSYAASLRVSVMYNFGGMLVRCKYEQNASAV